MPQKMLSDTYERIWMYNDTVTMKLMAVDEEKKGQKKRLMMNSIQNVVSVAIIFYV